jgi:signal transduction histidine kinase
MIMMALFVFIEAIDLYGLAVYNHEARVAAVVLKYSLYIFPMVRSSIVYQRLHIRYYKTFVSMPIHKWVSCVTAEDYSLFILVVYTIFSNLLQIFQPLYGSAGGLFFVEEYTPSYIICYGIMMVISTLFISAVPNHLSSFRRYLVDSELDGKRTLVRYVSHEIRTPLNSIILGLQIVEVPHSPSLSIHRFLLTV